MQEPINVLVVDDCDSVRESLVEYLNACHCNARGASSAKAAIEAMSVQAAEVVIVDLHLPGEGGEAFIRQASNRWPESKFVIFTGTPDYVPPSDLTAVPAQSPIVLSKPLLELKILLEAIHKLVGR